MKKIFLFTLIACTMLSYTKKETELELISNQCSEFYDTQISYVNDDIDGAVETIWFSGGDLGFIMWLEEIREEEIKHLKLLKETFCK